MNLFPGSYKYVYILTGPHGFIDRIVSIIHTALSYGLVRLFSKSVTNYRNAILIKNSYEIKNQNHSPYWPGRFRHIRSDITYYSITNRSVPGTRNYLGGYFGTHFEVYNPYWRHTLTWYVRLSHHDVRLKPLPDVIHYNSDVTLGGY